MPVSAMRALLRKWNYDVLGVGSGEEALAKFPEFAPHVILADVELPGMNGLDLLKHLGEEIASIPVIIITGRGSDERVVHAIEAGAYWYIEKPIEACPCCTRCSAALSATPAIRKRWRRSRGSFADAGKLRARWWADPPRRCRK